MIFNVVCLWYLIEMSSVCDGYWSRDYHDDTGIRVLLSETRVISIGIRAYLTVARALVLVDRFRTLWTSLSAYIHLLELFITTFGSIFPNPWLILLPALKKFLTKPFWIRRKWTRLTPEKPWTLWSRDYRFEAATKRLDRKSVLDQECLNDWVLES